MLIGVCTYLFQFNGILRKFIVLTFILIPAAMNQLPTGSGTVPLQESGVTFCLDG